MNSKKKYWVLETRKIEKSDGEDCLLHTPFYNQKGAIQSNLTATSGDKGGKKKTILSYSTKHMYCSYYCNNILQFQKEYKKEKDRISHLIAAFKNDMQHSTRVFAAPRASLSCCISSSSPKSCGNGI